MSCTGATPPNVPNFTKATYADWLDNTKFDSAPPPYFDDGAAGSLVAFAANTAALASGTGATSGGTENSYPGAAGGAVPASTSVAHEGAGTETVVNYPAAPLTPIQHTYPILPSGTESIFLHRTFSDLGSYTATPNASHASYLTGTVGVATPTTSVANGASNVSGAGTTLLTVTGTNFNRSSVVYVNGVAQTTNYVSATSLTVTNAPKRATAGTLPVTVVNGVGGTPSNATNWTFT
jgi:hypothetical protein